MPIQAFVSTRITQDRHPGDTYATDGPELLRLASTCACAGSERCRAGGLFAGFVTGKATSTALVVMLETTAQAYAATLGATRIYAPLRTDTGDHERLITDVADELLRVAGEFQVGMVVERHGMTLQTRDLTIAEAAAAAAEVAVARQHDYTPTTA